MVPEFAHAELKNIVFSFIFLLPANFLKYEMESFLPHPFKVYKFERSHGRRGGNLLSSRPD